MSRPRELLAAILTVNTLVNTAAAALAALVAIEWAEAADWDIALAVGIEVVAITSAILFFGELIPKLQALRDPEKWALGSARILQAVKWLASPVSVPLALLAGGLARLFGIRPQQTFTLSEEEIRALFHVGEKHGVLEEEEREMIHSIFEFGDTIAREVMVPRIDVVAVEKEISLPDLIATIQKFGHSRIPVFDGRIDNIIGVIHAKDLLPALREPESFEALKVIRPPFFIPEEKKIDDLLREFQSSKVHMAIVVDEYGGTAGVVTLEDIIEEIVGEIQDEYDREQPLVTRMDETTLIASGRVPIYDLNEHLDSLTIEESEAYDTLGGFVYSQLGRLPRRGDRFEFESLRFTVEELVGKRIVRVRIEKMEDVFGNA